MLSQLTNIGMDATHRIYATDSYSFLNDDSTKYSTIITSPRYNCGKDYGCNVDDSTTGIDYLKEMTQLGERLLAVANDDCLFFLNVGDNCKWPDRSWQVMKSIELTGWCLVQTIIWMKSFNGHGQFTPIQGNKHVDNLYENLFVLAKNKKSYSLDRLAVGRPFADTSNISRYGHTTDLRCSGNIWHISYETVGRTGKKGHAAPFPVELAKRCLLLNGAKGPVLDPFAGILSTARAAEQLGMEYTMVDLSYTSLATGMELLESDRQSRVSA